MAKKRENEKIYDSSADDTITIPVMEIFRQLGKYFIAWIVLLVVAAVLVGVYGVVANKSKDKPVTAAVGFYYSGIEKGLDPSGNEFDANSIKAPSVIETTLTDMGMDLTLVEDIRSSVVISGVIPDDAIDELTAYKSIFADTGSVDSAQRLMNVEYYPTSFEIKFNYQSLGFSQEEAVEFLNTMLDNYKLYFIDTYGVNTVFGTALKNEDYTSYDYPQAVDEVSNSISSLTTFINSLASANSVSFRSSVTGYTFEDLTSMAEQLNAIDVESTYSYIFQNSVTKDKEALIDYYNYRIESLERSLGRAQDKYDSIVDSIENYQKDSIVVFAGGTEETDALTMTQTSETYDDLIQQKIDVTSSIASYQSQIDEYQTRLDRLKKSSSVGNAEKQETADAMIDALVVKLNDLVDLVNDTVKDYYQTGALSGAYSVIVPATEGSMRSGTFDLMEKPLIVSELIIFVVYICFAIVRAFLVAYRQSQRLALATTGEDETDEEESPKEDTETREEEKKKK